MPSNDIVIETLTRKVMFDANRPVNLCGSHESLREFAHKILKEVGDQDTYGWINLPVASTEGPYEVSKKLKGDLHPDQPPEEM